VDFDMRPWLHFIPLLLTASALAHVPDRKLVSQLDDLHQTLAASYRYDPYGNTTYSSGSLAAANVYRFSSKEVHLNSGLYSYGYRFYSPNWQRWLNQDPIGEWGGINLYGFVGNEPIGLVDPLGLVEFSILNPISWYWPGYNGPTYSPPLPMPSTVQTAGSRVDWTPEWTGGKRMGDFTRDDVAIPAAKKSAELGLDVAMMMGGWGEAKAVEEALQAARAARAARLAAKCKAAEAKAAAKIKNILTKNLKPGPKGDISGAIHDMVGNPIPKPGGGTYDHVEDLRNILGGLRSNSEALKDATDPAVVAVRDQAQQAIQQIEAAIKGAGL